VRTRDRRGVLRTIAAGIATAGAEVHSARVLTDNGQAIDRFDLTDSEGHKLDDRIKQAIRQTVATGASPRRARRRRRLTVARQEDEAGRSSTRSDDETARP
jgi:UTP:GlnB (protein PII) uridylyltransferase